MDSTGSNSSAPAAEPATATPAQADVVIALTSYNDERTIAHVARALREGLSQYFGGAAALIALADAGSTDGTREAARASFDGAGVIEIDYPRSKGFVDLPYHGYPGRAAAVRAVLQAAQKAGAKACAFVDAGLDSVQPEWVERLLAPVMRDGFDYVSPCYQRRVNEGAITKAIVYPLFRALYGARLRQPAAGELGCSMALVTHYLDHDLWELESADIGIDTWLASAAVSGGFRTCESPMGVRSAPHKAPVDLATAIAHVVGALFIDLEHRVEDWQRIRGSAELPQACRTPDTPMDAGAMNIDGLVDSFRLGYRELREIWTWVLPPRTIVELRKLTETPADRFRIDDRLWAGIVYDFAIGHNLRVMPVDHLMRSLAPLYIGWLASFMNQVGAAPPAQVEERLEQVCLAFEAEKRHLISRWRWPERMR
jgi:glycosyltransferase involved in cell wall biosynthesis